MVQVFQKPVLQRTALLAVGSLIALLYLLELAAGQYSVLLYPVIMVSRAATLHGVLTLGHIASLIVVAAGAMQLVGAATCTLPRVVRRTLIFLQALILSLTTYGYLFLLNYRLRTGLSFNLSFLRFNSEDALLAVARTYPAALVGFVVLFVVTALLYTRQLSTPRGFSVTKAGVGQAILTAAAIAFIVLAPRSAASELQKFVGDTLFADRSFADAYEQALTQHLSERRQTTPPVLSDTNALGNSIFFLKIESVSSFVADERVTPNFYAMQQDGLLFPAFYSSSVQTIRAEEVLLCGVPPTPGKTLVQKMTPNELAELPCLPRIFRNAGYRTLFFKDDRLSFADTGRFMSAIGFDEVHNEDIMQPGDHLLPWGFREDIFIQRVLEYLERYQGERLFVYVALSATNHLPFKLSDERLASRVPYPSATLFTERYANTTFAQDWYASSFLGAYRERYGADATLIFFADHPWPIARHGNTYNEVGAYEENFLTVFSWLPPGWTAKQWSRGVVPERWSQLDVYPTILELAGTACPKCLGESFAHVLNASDTVRPAPQKPKISMQPYSGGFLSVVDYPQKYLIDFTNQRVLRYWLDRDAEEREPEYAGGVEFGRTLIQKIFED